MHIRDEIQIACLIKFENLSLFSCAKKERRKKDEARGTRTPNRSIWSRARYQLRHSPYLLVRVRRQLN